MRQAERLSHHHSRIEQSSPSKDDKKLDSEDSQDGEHSLVENRQYLDIENQSPTHHMSLHNDPSLKPMSKESPHRNSLLLKNRPHLTLDEIRAGLGLSGLRQTSKPSEAPTAAAKSSFTFDAEELSGDQGIRKLTSLCFELLEFTSLLEQKRGEAAKEWSEKSQVARQFERLYDSVRDREILFREKVEEQQRKFQIREGKYINLKKRARQHLKEWQTDRDRFALESHAASRRVQDLEAQLACMNAEVASQKETLILLKEKGKNIPSEKETTDLNLRLRSLQNENAQFMTDHATLKLILDEKVACLQKRYPNSNNTPECLNTLLGTVVLNFDHHRYRPLDDDKKTPSASNEIMLLEKMADELQNSIKEQALQFQQEKKELLDRRNNLKQYIEALQGMLLRSDDDASRVT